MSHDQPLPTGRTASGGDASVSRRDDDPGPSGAAVNPGGSAPQQQQQQPDVGEAPMPAPAPATSGRPEASRSLYIGKLHPSVNEAMLLEIFSTLGAVQEVKVIRDKLTSLSAGYGFVTYYDARCGLLCGGSCACAHRTHPGWRGPVYTQPARRAVGGVPSALPTICAATCTVLHFRVPNHMYVCVFSSHNQYV